jgi:hypothetical protein
MAITFKDLAAIESEILVIKLTFFSSGEPFPALHCLVFSFIAAFWEGYILHSAVRISLDGQHRVLRNEPWTGMLLAF